MKKLMQALPLLLVMLAAVPSQAMAGGNINAFLGGKGLNSDDWEANAHSEGGVLLDFGGENWPVNIAVDVLGSSGGYDNVHYSSSLGLYYYEEDVKTSELSLGVRKYWNGSGNMHPYLGGGLAFIRLSAVAKIDGTTVIDDSDSGTGLWIGGGIQWRFDQFNLGFSVRASAAQVTLGGNEYQAGGAHTGVVLGYHW